MRVIYNAIRIYFISKALIKTLLTRFPDANYTIWVNHWMDNTFQVRCVSGFKDDKQGEIIREYKWYNEAVTYEEKISEASLLDWFRKQHNIHIVLHPVKDEPEKRTAWNIILTDLEYKGYMDACYTENLVVLGSSLQYYKTYEEALAVAAGMAMGIVTERQTKTV